MLPDCIRADASAADWNSISHACIPLAAHHSNVTELAKNGSSRASDLASTRSFKKPCLRHGPSRQHARALKARCCNRHFVLKLHVSRLETHFCAEKCFPIVSKNKVVWRWCGAIAHVIPNGKPTAAYDTICAKIIGTVASLAVIVSCRFFELIKTVMEKFSRGIFLME